MGIPYKSYLLLKQLGHLILITCITHRVNFRFGHRSRNLQRPSRNLPLDPLQKFNISLQRAQRGTKFYINNNNKSRIGIRIQLASTFKNATNKQTNKREVNFYREKRLPFGDRDMRSHLKTEVTNSSIELID